MYSKLDPRYLVSKSRKVNQVGKQVSYVLARYLEIFGTNECTTRYSWTKIQTCHNLQTKDSLDERPLALFVKVSQSEFAVLVIFEFVT